LVPGIFEAFFSECHAGLAGGLDDLTAFFFTGFPVKKVNTAEFFACGFFEWAGGFLSTFMIFGLGGMGIGIGTGFGGPGGAL
jgi:hypothetical protein